VHTLVEKSTRPTAGDRPAGPTCPPTGQLTRRSAAPVGSCEAVDVQWSPRVGETVATAAVGVALALAAALVDPVGRVLVGAAAVALLGLTVRDLLVRPRLRADPDGVTVRRLRGATTVPWPVLQVRVRVTRRLGLRARTLELEDRSDDAVLVVLGRRELGADPQVVAEALTLDGPGAAPNG
jgi:PH (Pleckstrin Homology) domain-containing protein